MAHKVLVDELAFSGMWNTDKNTNKTKQNPA